MTVTKASVMAAGEQAAMDAVSYNAEIELCLYDDKADILEKLRDAVDDSYNYDAYTVDYYHEAWDIVTDSDFTPCDTVDFSGCTDAMQCVMKEAEASIDDVVREGWDNQLESFADALEDMLDTMRKRMGYTEDDVLIKIGSGSQFGWEVHNYETDYCCVWDDESNEYYAHKLEDELYAIETTIDGTCFYFCWNPDLNQENND